MTAGSSAPSSLRPPQPERARRLVVESLTAPFGVVAGLHDVTLDVAAGEIVVLLGPSGTGKTTLLRAIAGFAPIAGGRVVIAGRDVSALPPEQRGAVYLHQSPVLFPHLSVHANVAFPMLVRGVPARERDARVRTILATMQVSELAARMPRTLSGGQARRVALARAVAANADVVLLDEPLTGLDPVLRSDLRDAIASVRQASAPALLVVTHDLDDAAVLADRVGVMLGGRLAQLGTPAEVLLAPATAEVASLVGFVNAIAGESDGDGRIATALGCVPVPTRRRGAVTVMFRTDAGHVTSAGRWRGEVRDVRITSGRATVVLSSAGGMIELAAAAHGLPRVGEIVAFDVDLALASVF